MMRKNWNSLAERRWKNPFKSLKIMGNDERSVEIWFSLLLILLFILLRLFRLMEYWLKEKIIYQRRFSEGRKKIANDEGVTFAYSRAFLAALLFFLLLTHFWWLEFGSCGRSMTRPQNCLRHPSPVSQTVANISFLFEKWLEWAVTAETLFIVSVWWLVRRGNEHKKAPVGRESFMGNCWFL